MALTEKIAIVGMGAVGRSLCFALAERGATQTIWSRSAEVVEDALVFVRDFHPDAELTVSTGFASVAAADVVLLCVRDDAIAEVAEQIAAVATEPRISLHTSGYHSRAELVALERKGWSVGSLHPLAAMPSAKLPWSGHLARFAIEGDERARACAERIAVELGGEVLHLGSNPSDKHAYHAGAALLSNGLVALFDAALRVASPDAGPSPELAQAYLRLLESTVLNLESVGLPEALTGPATRGEENVIRGHLDVVGAERDLYVALTRRMLRLAREKGDLTERQVHDIESLLD